MRNLTGVPNNPLGEYMCMCMWVSCCLCCTNEQNNKDKVLISTHVKQIKKYRYMINLM